MPVLVSKLNPRSEAFKASTAAMQVLVQDLNARLARIADQRVTAQPVGPRRQGTRQVGRDRQDRHTRPRGRRWRRYG